MAIDLNNRVEDNAYISTNEITLGSPRSKINLDGTLAYNAPTSEASLRLTTPFSTYVSNVLHMSHMFPYSTYVSIVLTVGLYSPQTFEYGYIQFHWSTSCILKSSF